MQVQFLQGVGVGAGLIIAIGAQNAFVLTQGIRKQHHWLVALVCGVSDALLIFLGVTGFGTLVAKYPAVREGAGWMGALFLFWYGCKALKGVVVDKSLQQNEKVTVSLKGILLTTVAITFLNPHVYIDTLLLLGSIGSQYSDDGRYLFALGASTSSILWFFALSFGGVLLAPLFKRPVTWKVLDIVVWCTMWSIAYQLMPIKF